MSRDFDGELVTIAAEMGQLRQQMAEAREAWMDVTAPWLAQCWQDQAKAIVVDQADHANDVGAAVVKSIRAEVENLAQRARPMMTQRLVTEAGEKRWPDLKPQTETRDPDFWSSTSGIGSTFEVSQPNRPDAPSQLHGPMRKLEAEVLPILKTQGFVTQRSDFSTAGPRFHALQPNWTPEMVNAINGYAELHEAYLEKIEQTVTVKREKARTEAANLWDD